MKDAADMRRFFTDNNLTGDFRKDIPAFLHRYDYQKTVLHCAEVAKEAARLAQRFAVDAESAEKAGWLHDVSAVIPTPERVAFAHAFNIEVLPGEVALPMILHQKLSAVLAREVFGVLDNAVLSAIECHTTLKEDASRLDKVVFLADKIAWDQPGEPPYLDKLLAALEDSLDVGTCVYLSYLWERRHTLAVIHPWLIQAYAQLCAQDSGVA